MKVAFILIPQNPAVKGKIGPSFLMCGIRTQIPDLLIGLQAAEILIK